MLKIGGLLENLLENYSKTPKSNAAVTENIRRSYLFHEKLVTWWGKPLGSLQGLCDNILLLFS